jgi:hypothetical protein
MVASGLGPPHWCPRDASDDAEAGHDPALAEAPEADVLIGVPEAVGALPGSGSA